MNDAEGILEEFVFAQGSGHQDWEGMSVYDPLVHNQQKRDSDRWSRKVCRRERHEEYVNRWSDIKNDPDRLEKRRARERVYDAKRRAKYGS